MAQRSNPGTAVGLEQLIEELDLTEQQRQSMKQRWLDQVTWMDRRATRSRISFVVLRLITILGGVAIPALVEVKTGDHSAPWALRTATALGLAIAAAASVESFFHFGERWQHYRHATEELRAEGWRFIQLAGRAYAPRPGDPPGSHQDLFPTFAERVEENLGRDVTVFLRRVSPPTEEAGKKRGEN
jgi:hypothetical protein